MRGRRGALATIGALLLGGRVEAAGRRVVPEAADGGARDRPGGAASVADATPVTHPDVVLIAACAEYLRVQRTFEAACRAAPGDMTAGHPAVRILDPVDGLVETIVGLRARTAEGHVARARCAAFHVLPGNAACRDNTEGAAEDRFAAAGLRDLVWAEKGAGLQLGSAASCEPRQPGASPDAGLLAAVERFAAADQRQRAACILAMEEIEASDLPPKLEAARAAEALDALKPGDVELDRMLHEIASQMARTAEGRAAKARLVERWLSDSWTASGKPRDAWENVAWSLAQDALNSGTAR